jgi:hypothetical protein
VIATDPLALALPTVTVRIVGAAAVEYVKENAFDALPSGFVICSL